jgi:hypothetical protein
MKSPLMAAARLRRGSSQFKEVEGKRHARLSRERLGDFGNDSVEALLDAVNFNRNGISESCSGKEFP